MNKSEGKKVSIKFSDKIMGNLDLLPKLPLIVGKFINPKGFFKSSSQYSISYEGARSFDGDVNTPWYTRSSGSQWVQISTFRPLRIGGFRWYMGSSHRPKDFILEGSNDGITWIEIYSGISEDTTGWKEFYWEYGDPYLYYRWNVNSRHSSYIYIYEIELFVHEERAINIYGNQWDYVGGEIKRVDYAIQSVEHHPTEEYTLLITLHENYQEAFDEIVGDLTLEYKGKLGNLVGYGGALEDFSVSFTPVDLISSPNPGVIEHLMINALSAMDLIPLTFIKGYGNNETLKVEAFTITTELIYSNIENP